MTKLDSSQAQVLMSDAPLKLVVACPGSGKTRTLVALVSRECVRSPASKVAVVTYTNAAADEVKRRLSEEGPHCSGLGFCGTLHSLLLRLVRANPGLTGLSPAATVAEAAAAEQLLESTRDEMRVKVSDKKLKAKAGDRVALAKIVATGRPAGKSPEDLVVFEYHRKLAEASVLTFDSLLIRGLALLRRMGPGDWPFAALFWDEAQDGAEEDFDIAELAPSGRKTLVGDPDQSIYGFRGASPTRFTALLKDPRWKTFRLDSNYRSGPTICAAADCLVSRNSGHVRREMVSASGKDSVVLVRECQDERGEMRVALVESEREAAWSDTAVLARTRARAAAVAEYLRAYHIRVREEREPARPGDWRTASLLLAVMAAPWSDFACHSYVYAREGSRQVADGLLRKAESKAQRMSDLYLGEGWDDGIAGCKVHRSRLQEFLESHKVSRESAEFAAAAAGDAEPLTVEELVFRLARPEPSAPASTEPAVTVCTAHGAKGLEFDTVVVVGAEEGSFPHKRATTTEEVEEERRLFFVALTRAKRRLVVTWCKTLKQSRGPNLPPGPPADQQRSRFLQEAGL